MYARIISQEFHFWNDEARMITGLHYSLTPWDKVTLLYLGSKQCITYNFCFYRHNNTSTMKAVDKIKRIVKIRSCIVHLQYLQTERRVCRPSLVSTSWGLVVGGLGGGGGRGRGMRSHTWAGPPSATPRPHLLVFVLSKISRTFFSISILQKPQPEVLHLVSDI